MARERSDLEHRRGELTRSLPGLSDNRADTFRRNSDALALDRAGVKHERPEEMVRLEEAEVAANAAIRDVQRELRDIDAEIKLRPRPGLGARFGRTARRARAARCVLCPSRAERSTCSTILACSWCRSTGRGRSLPPRRHTNRRPSGPGVRELRRPIDARTDFTAIARAAPTRQSTSPGQVTGGELPRRSGGRAPNRRLAPRSA